MFDLDGTLLDSDEALAQAFVALGVPRDEVTFGHVLEEECRRLGIDIDAYLDAYDTSSAQPFPGVGELVASLDRWAVCSNKIGTKATAELARLGWRPAVALFTESFNGPKQLRPVLDALDARPADIVFVGDTDHDRRCAAAVGAPFALAGWNPRAVPAPADIVLDQPSDLLRHL